MQHHIQKYVPNFANQLRSIIAILLASLFLVQSMTRTFIVLNYHVNKDYVANVLCENKEKKELQCEGKCHLKKELQKEEKKESTPTGDSKEKFDTNLFSIVTHRTPVFSDTNTKKSFFFLEENTRKISIPVFHPPGFSA